MEGVQAEGLTEQFLDRLQVQRTEHKTIVEAAAIVNTLPVLGDTGVELWIEKLGIDLHVAGLHKDEMPASY